MDGLGYLIIPNELVPFDVQELLLTLHMECLEGSGIGTEKSPGFSCLQ